MKRRVWDTMAFRDAAFDPDTISLMTGALETAWREAQERHLIKASADTARAMMASAILAAVSNGERNPMRLKNLAMRAVDATGLH
jgi:hypothetical protein